MNLELQAWSVSMNEQRTSEFRKDVTQEEQLQRMNELLWPYEKDAISQFTEPAKPTLFIVGAPRSATTLVYQLVSDTGLFGYISNYIARFYAAPFIGALQAKTLGMVHSSKMSFESKFGRTKGWHEPHQFNYFWRKWFRYDKDHQMNQSFIESMDKITFRREIAALENVFQQPMAFKSLYCGLQVEFLKRTLPKSRFVICTRNPLYQAQSILSGRKAFFGTYEGWFSLKPAEYSSLKEMDVFHQVAGQIYYILKSIGSGLKAVGEHEYQIIDQEDLIRDPRGVMSNIIKLGGQDPTKANLSNLPESFENRNEQKLPDEEWEQLKEAIDDFFGDMSCRDVLLDSSH